jgi:tyrosyl-tRNA synthetase
MYGKVMSISDELMFRYWALLTDLPEAEMERMKSDVKSGALHPMKAKGDLAARLVADFHGTPEARRAAEHFTRVHRRKGLPEKIEVHVADRLPTTKDSASAESDAVRPPLLVDILVSSGLAPSKSEARRQIKAGAVEIDGTKVTDAAFRIPADRSRFVVRYGRRQFRRIELDSRRDSGQKS